MSTFVIDLPNGQSYEVDAPDDASDAQVRAILQGYLKTPDGQRLYRGKDEDFSAPEPPKTIRPDAPSTLEQMAEQQIRSSSREADFLPSFVRLGKQLFGTSPASTIAQEPPLQQQTQAPLDVTQFARPLSLDPAQTVVPRHAGGVAFEDVPKTVPLTIPSMEGLRAPLQATQRALEQIGGTQQQVVALEAEGSRALGTTFAPVAAAIGRTATSTLESIGKTQQEIAATEAIAISDAFDFLLPNLPKDLSPEERQALPFVSKAFSSMQSGIGGGIAKPIGVMLKWLLAKKFREKIFVIKNCKRNPAVVL